MPSRGILSGVKPLPDIPDWIGGGDPANDGKVLAFDSSQPGGAAPSATNAVIPTAFLSRSQQVGGNITLPNSNLVDVAAQTGGPGSGGLDLTIAAAAGDVLEIAVFVIVLTRAAFDVATWVSGAAVNWVGQTAGASPGTNNGWLWDSTGQVEMSVPALYTVVSGDISGGNVVLRLMGAGNGATATLARSVLTGPLMFSVKNLKH